MTQLRFLFDEDTDPDLIEALLRREPAVDALRVGWEGAPAEGTLDPDVLLAAESLGRMLISRDKQTMPDHLAAHFAAGRHTHGVALLRQGFSFGTHVGELLMLWSASEAEEWIDATLYLPF